MCPLTTPYSHAVKPGGGYFHARLYKGDLASPSRHDSLFTTLSTHSFLVPLLT